MDGEIGPEAVRPLAGPTWHLMDALRSLTLCGQAFGYSARTRLWSETPEEDRCLLCLRRIRLALEPG